MPEKLSDLFEEAKTWTVTWEGHTVHSIVERRVPAEATLLITFADLNPARPEGLRLKVGNGTVSVAGRELTDIIFWSDSAPGDVQIRVHATDAFAKIRLWNCWRDPRETVQSWIGNAGMLFERTDSGFLLRCSDGFDDVSFDDLVVLVEVSSG